jgi:hypothetical protein
MAVAVFTDLDDTLFATTAKASARAAGRPLVPAAMDRAGTALSFHAPDQLTLLGLFDGCTLIPVTGRNRDALERVLSPRFDDYRIFSHGALIYTPEGEPLAPWHARIAAEAARWEQTLHTLAERLLTRFAPLAQGLRARVIEDAGLPVYVSVKTEHGAALPAAEALAEAAADLGEGWRIHRNGRNAACLPPYACKARAVAHVMELKRREDPDAMFLGLGDSLSDAAFLKLCDFAILPRDSQIQERL